jgi:hypothetical protein
MANKKLSDYARHYPIFEPNQVLTAEDLNSVVKFLEGEDPTSRRILGGVGLACGLDGWRSGTKITVRKGFGIASSGDLIFLAEDTEFGFLRKISKWPDALSDQGKNLPAPWELLTDDPQNDPGVRPLAEVLADKAAQPPELSTCILLAYAEHQETAQPRCVEENCDNTGKRVDIQPRFFLVSSPGAGFILDNEKLCSAGALNLAKLPAPEAFAVARPVISFPQDASTGSTSGSSSQAFIKSQLLKSIDATLKAWEGAWDQKSTLHSWLVSVGTALGVEVPATIAIASLRPIVVPLPPKRALMTELEAGRRVFSVSGKSRKTTLERGITTAQAASTSSEDAGMDLAELQCWHDRLKDVSSGLRELVRALAQIADIPCPDSELFAHHLLLGTIGDGTTVITKPLPQPCGTRYGYFPSPAMAGSTQRRRAASLLKRVILLFECFSPEAAKSVSQVKITADPGPTAPLGQRSIPSYYLLGTEAAPDQLLTYWSFEHAQTRWQQYLRYAGSSDDCVKALGWCSEADVFFRICGHGARPLVDVWPELEKLRQDGGVPFRPMALCLDGKPASMVEENLVIPTELVRAYSDARQRWLSALTTEYNFFSTLPVPSDNTGRLSGTIKMPDKSELPAGAALRVEGSDQLVAADANGKFDVELLEGNYVVQAVVGDVVSDRVVVNVGPQKQTAQDLFATHTVSASDSGVRTPSASPVDPGTGVRSKVEDLADPGTGTRIAMGAKTRPISEYITQLVGSAARPGRLDLVDLGAKLAAMGKKDAAVWTAVSKITILLQSMIGDAAKGGTGSDAILPVDLPTQVTTLENAVKTLAGDETQLADLAAPLINLDGTSASVTSQQVLIQSHAEVLRSFCFAAQLGTIVTAYSGLRKSQQDQLMLRDFVSKHSGLEHVGGVWRGGTLVLVYDSTGTVRGDFALPYYCSEATSSVLQLAPTVLQPPLNIHDTITFRDVTKTIVVPETTRPTTAAGNLVVRSIVTDPGLLATLSVKDDHTILIKPNPALFVDRNSWSFEYLLQDRSTGNTVVGRVILDVVADVSLPPPPDVYIETKDPKKAVTVATILLVDQVSITAVTVAGANIGTASPTAVNKVPGKAIVFTPGSAFATAGRADLSFTVQHAVTKSTATGKLVVTLVNVLDPPADIHDSITFRDTPKEIRVPETDKLTTSGGSLIITAILADLGKLAALSIKDQHTILITPSAALFDGRKSLPFQYQVQDTLTKKTVSGNVLLDLVPIPGLAPPAELAFRTRDAENQMVISTIAVPEQSTITDAKLTDPTLGTAAPCPVNNTPGRGILFTPGKRFGLAKNAEVAFTVKHAPTGNTAMGKVSLTLLPPLQPPKDIQASITFRGFPKPIQVLDPSSSLVLDPIKADPAAPVIIVLKDERTILVTPKAAFFDAYKSWSFEYQLRDKSIDASLIGNNTTTGKIVLNVVPEKGLEAPAPTRFRTIDAKAEAIIDTVPVPEQATIIGASVMGANMGTASPCMVNKIAGKGIRFVPGSAYGTVERAEITYTVEHSVSNHQATSKVFASWRSDLDPTTPFTATITDLSATKSIDLPWLKPNGYYKIVSLPEFLTVGGNKIGQVNAQSPYGPITFKVGVSLSVLVKQYGLLKTLSGTELPYSFVVRDQDTNQQVTSTIKFKFIFLDSTPSKPSEPVTPSKPLPGDVSLNPLNLGIDAPVPQPDSDLKLTLDPATPKVDPKTDPGLNPNSVSGPTRTLAPKPEPASKLVTKAKRGAEPTQPKKTDPQKARPSKKRG